VPVKTLVLVLGTRVAPFPMLIRMIKETWASVFVPDVETLFYYGGPTLERRGDELDVPVADDLAHVGRKTIACFEFVLDHCSFELIFRTNTSTYVDLPNLCTFVGARARRDRFYSGALGTSGVLGRPLPFASGSGYFLSRDLVELLVDERARLIEDLVDDVAVAAVLAEFDVAPEPAPRQDFDSVRQLKYLDASQFHFRCRTQSWRRLEDARIMRELHRILCAERDLPVPNRSLATWALESAVWRPAVATHAGLRRVHRAAYWARRRAAARLRSSSL
jgi:hypothetical protein